MRGDKAESVSAPIPDKAETPQPPADFKTGEIIAPKADEAPNKSAKKVDENKVTSKPATNQSGQAIEPADKTVQCTEDPVNPRTGEELLQLVDFTLPDGFVWERVYRSSHNQDVGLGIGWTHRYSGHLRIINEQQLEYFDHEGKFIQIDTPAIGSTWRNSRLQIVIKRTADKEYIAAYRSGEVYHFSGTGDRLPLKRFIETNGRSTQFEYDAIGRLAQITTPFGTRLHASYQDEQSTHLQQLNMVDQQDLAIGKPWMSFEYDANDDLIRATDRGNGSEQYAYNNHVITQRTLANGFSFYFEWSHHTVTAKCVKTWGDNNYLSAHIDYEHHDEHFIGTKVTNALGHNTYYQFDADTGQINGIKNHQLDGVDIEYNEEGHPVLVRQAIDHSATEDCADTLYTYDDIGQLTSVTDALGAATEYAYNEFGLVTKIVNAAGAESAFTYNDKGQRLTETNALGHTTEYEYDDQSRLAQIKRASGAVELYTWNDQGQLDNLQVLPSAPDENPDQSTMVYHAPKWTRCYYNSLGQLTKQQTGDNITTFIYDDMGRPLEIHRPQGVESYQYTLTGQVSAHTDTSNRTTTYEYDGTDRLLKKTEANGKATTYEYDAAGQLSTLTHPDGQQTTFDYDENAKLIREVGVDGRVQQYQYNLAGHLIAQYEGERVIEYPFELNGKQDVWRENQTAGLTCTRYQRDLLGRLTLKNTHIVPTGSNVYDANALKDAEVSTFQYDKLGQIIEAKNAHSTTKWEYDLLGQVVIEQQDEHVIEHEYGIEGHRTQTCLPNGQVVQHHFDSLGQWSGTGLNGQQLIRVAYNTMGQITAQHFGHVQRQFQYNPIGQLTKQHSWIDDGQQTRNISEQQYRYDTAGRITDIDNPACGNTRYAYDDQDRLLQAKHQRGYGSQNECFEYDGNSNLHKQGTNQTTYESNRLTQWGDKRLSYTDSGNTKKITSTAGSSQHFGYNKQNQLDKLYLESGNLVQVEYQYDALGRRVKKLNHKDQSSIQFIWDGDQLIGEIRDHQHLETPEEIYYLYQPNTYVPIAQLRNNKVYYYHTDHLGTPQIITDDKGITVWQADYAAWGEISVQYQEIDNPLRFQGQYHDLESGLYYTRHRYYSPEFGRFITQDPIGLLGGLNAYQYAPNPVHWVDPLGLCRQKPRISAEIDGKKIKRQVLEGYAPYYDRVTNLSLETTVILLEHNPNDLPQVVARGESSVTSAEQKEKTFTQMGYKHNFIRLPSNTSVEEFTQQIQNANNNNNVSGIIVQMPVPFEFEPAVRAIAPEKDLDALSQGSPNHPATSEGICHLAEPFLKPDSKVVVLGGKGFVGAGVAQTLQNKGYDTSIIDVGDSRDSLYNADVVITTIGKPGVISAADLGDKQRTALIDSGFTPTPTGPKGDFTPDAQQKADHFTPVPGGIGPTEMAVLSERILKKDFGDSVPEWNFDGENVKFTNNSKGSKK